MQIIMKIPFIFINILRKPEIFFLRGVSSIAEIIVNIFKFYNLFKFHYFLKFLPKKDDFIID